MKTLDYYLNQPEGQTYDKKSGRILPGRVRLNNMRTTHFSRNPKIAAFMKEYEFIREFGEGVDRMYRELEEGGWEKPVFKQDDFILRASLKSRFYTEGLQKDSNKQTGSQIDDTDTLQNNPNSIQINTQYVTSLSQVLSQVVPSLSPAKRRSFFNDGHGYVAAAFPTILNIRTYERYWGKEQEQIPPVCVKASDKHWLG